MDICFVDMIMVLDIFLDIFLAVLSSLTGTLYQVQCADFNCESAYISGSTFSMCLWYCRMEYLCCGNY